MRSKICFNKCVQNTSISGSLKAKHQKLLAVIVVEEPYQKVPGKKTSL